MLTIHRALTVVVVLVALAGTMWAVYLAYKQRWSARLSSAGSAATAVLALQALFGIVLAVQGDRPHDPIHFVIGPATLLALPAARVLARDRAEGARRLLVAAGWVVTLGLALRAAGTGGLGGLA
ncbi:MAG: hypothetical protein ACREN2_03320 [Candidatus Dormibacteria bacterium]